MKPAVSRLLVFGLLYLGWMAYLAFLVVTRPLTPTGQPLVVSIPQVQSSELDVVAELPAPTSRDSPNGVEVTIKEVLFTKRGEEIQPGQKIRVLNLDDCRPPQRDKKLPLLDWSGPGAYLLVLHSAQAPLGLLKGKETLYEVAAIPPSPGYPGGPPRLHPATEEALAQYHKIRKPE